MSEETTPAPATATAPVRLPPQKDQTLGIVAFVFGAVSIVFFAPLFVPLALLLAFIALFKRNFLFSFLAIVCAVIGYLTSPVLLTLTAAVLASLGLF